MDLKNKLKKTLRNSVRLTIEGEAENKTAATRFGGKPDVPENFSWYCYEGEDCEGNIKKRPLSFIAQFNLADISKYDTENLLPKTGLLSFFYEAETAPWGFDPKDRGCARVCYFEDTEKLAPMDFPSDLREDLRFPAIGIKAKSEDSYQDYPDFLLQRDKLLECWDDYDRAAKGLKINIPENSSKLLGWADIIQSNMTKECELVSRGYYLGGDLSGVTPRDMQEAEQSSLKDWLLLFQLDTVEKDGFELMFGDCGRIYYYIRKEELEARNFDNVWLISQCG